MYYACCMVLVGTMALMAAAWAVAEGKFQRLLLFGGTEAAPCCSVFVEELEEQHQKTSKYFEDDWDPCCRGRHMCKQGDADRVLAAVHCCCCCCLATNPRYPLAQLCT
jgi:hypothetical protein